MPDMTSKQDLIAYFADKSQRSEKEGGTYFQTVNELLMILDETDNIAEIKSFVRNLHREKLKEQITVFKNVFKHIHFELMF